MADIKVKFQINKLPYYAVSVKNGRKAMELQGFDGALTVSVQYSHNRRPLDLSCDIAQGDKVEIILLDYRIELYVNGELKDEEWPAGDRFIDTGDGFFPESEVEITEYVAIKPVLPDTIATFENAEGWRPGNGVFVGDCMPYIRNGEYHVLYLKDRHHHKSKWGMGAHQWEHISTRDFSTWHIHPMAVPITHKSEGSICTGSWISAQGKEYLYYTVRRMGGLPATVGRSVSTDGYRFEKDEFFGFELSDKYHKASARDPKVFLGEDGLYHMLLTTTLLSEDKGCLAHYVSSDMESWEDYGAPIYVVPNGDQPECPDYFKYGGKYYLIFSLRGRARYMISHNPFDGFTMPKNPEIPCAGVPKCAPWEGKLVFTGFKVINGYAGTMTFNSATALENGELVFDIKDK